MISRNCSPQQAKELTIELFFKNNIEQYDKQTYERFLDAFKTIKQAENQPSSCAFTMYQKREVSFK